MSANRTVDEVCSSVADGAAIDWPALDSEAREEDARDLLEQLRIIADVAIAHRSLEDTASSTRTRGVAAVVSGSEPLPRRWGRYDLLEELGHGTFGRVYRAADPDLQRFLAIKLLRPTEGMTDVLNDRVLHEGRAIAKVVHPNVVSVYSVEVHDRQVGLCMELVNGKTLDTIVKTQGTLSALEATMIGQSVCRALCAVHGAGLVHRDVKARNVMRAEGGRIVLMDFGTGEVLRDETEARNGAPQGTPIYMAPEALTGAPGSVATDIYSTGVLLYFLVSGRYPFEGATTAEVKRAHAQGERRFVSDHRPDLPVPFVRAVEKALDPNPERRQRRASQLLIELIEASEFVQPEPGPSPWDQFAAFVARNGTRALSVGVAAAVAFLALGFFNSFAYGFTLGLDSSFLREGPLDWLYWGWKSMIAPLVVMVAVVLVVFVCAEVIGLVRRVSSVADQGFRHAGAALEKSIRRTRLTPSSALACVIVVVSLVFDWWIVARQFPELLNAAVTSVDMASATMLARLGPANYDEQVAYRQVLSVAALAMVFGLFKVSQMASRRGERVRPLLFAAAVATTLFTIGLLDLPYRILWMNDSERVTYNNAQCYAIASKGDSVRLFCGSRTPRSMVVAANDPGLVRSQTTENIFTPFTPTESR
jgi:protein kinase-like protein